MTGAFEFSDSDPVPYRVHTKSFELLVHCW